MRLILPGGYSGPVEGPCLACRALYGSTCCEDVRSEGPRFPVSLPEARRLAKLYALDVSEAVDIRTLDDEEHDALTALGSPWKDLIVEGVGLYLPVEAQRCRYLGIGGCNVSENKPHTCRLFPFARDKDGGLSVRRLAGTGYCLAVDVCNGDVEKVMKLFGETPASLFAVEKARARDLVVHKAEMRAFLREV